MPGLNEIGQIHISVTDIDRSVAFYRDCLGLEFLFQVPEQSMAFFDCGGVRLYLGAPESSQFQCSSLIYFRVASIDDTYKTLAERGVEFFGGPHLVHKSGDSELWMAFFRDPGGNNLALMAESPTG